MNIRKSVSDWFSDNDTPGKKLFGVFSKIRRNHQAEKAVQTLIENSHLEMSFFVMCSLSGILAAIGILLNDTAILIAAMVLAPLLNPVLAMAAGLTALNKKLIMYALKSFVGGIISVVLISAIFVYFWDWHGYTFDLTSFEEKFSTMSQIIFTAAFVSGFSGVYAWLRAKGQSNIIGVAIAVSLVPFISFFGILLGLQKFDKMWLYLGAFTINILAIISGAIIAFLYLGFGARTKKIDQQLEKVN